MFLLEGKPQALQTLSALVLELSLLPRGLKAIWNLDFNNRMTEITWLFEQDILIGKKNVYYLIVG